MAAARGSDARISDAIQLLWPAVIYRLQVCDMDSSSFVKSWQNSKAVRRNFYPGPCTVQLSTNKCWNKLGALLDKFCKAGCTSIIGIFKLLQTRTAFRRFRGRKTFVRWTRDQIGQLSFISWRCWVYLPVPSPRFLLFGRRSGVTLARFSYFPGTCKYPSTLSLQRYYLKTLPLTSCRILKILYI